MAKLTICVRENETLAIGQRYKVFLRVTHNGRTCYAETGVSVGTSLVKGKVIVNLKYGVVLPQEPGSDILNADLLQLLRKAPMRPECVWLPPILVHQVPRLLKKL